MEIFLSNKGKEMCCWQDHVYTIKYVGKTKKRWRCIKVSFFKCRGTMYTRLNNTFPELGILHNHGPHEDKIQVNDCSNFKTTTLFTKMLLFINYFK